MDIETIERLVMLAEKSPAYLMLVLMMIIIIKSGYLKFWKKTPVPKNAGVDNSAALASHEKLCDSRHNMINTRLKSLEENSQENTSMLSRLCGYFEAKSGKPLRRVAQSKNAKRGS